MIRLLTEKTGDGNMPLKTRVLCSWHGGGLEESRDILASKVMNDGHRRRCAVLKGGCTCYNSLDFF